MQKPEAGDPALEIEDEFDVDRTPFEPATQVENLIFCTGLTDRKEMFLKISNFAHQFLPGLAEPVKRDFSLQVLIELLMYFKEMTGSE